MSLGLFYQHASRTLLLVVVAMIPHHAHAATPCGTVAQLFGSLIAVCKTPVYEGREYAELYLTTAGDGKITDPVTATYCQSDYFPSPGITLPVSLKANVSSAGEIVYEGDDLLNRTWSVRFLTPEVSPFDADTKNDRAAVEFYSPGQRSPSLQYRLNCSMSPRPNPESSI